MSRLEWQIGGDAERSGNIHANKYMTVRRGITTEMSSIRRGDLEGFFAGQNVAQGFQRDRQRALAGGVGAPVVGFNPESMIDQFRATRGANYCSEAYSVWDDAGAGDPPLGNEEDDPEGFYGSHPTWGKSASEAFAGEKASRVHPSMHTLRDLDQLPVNAVSDPARTPDLLNAYTGGYTVPVHVETNQGKRAPTAYRTPLALQNEAGAHHGAPIRPPRAAFIRPVIHPEDPAPPPKGAPRRA